jgi:uncharacterized lipoprotein YmbA
MMNLIKSGLAIVVTFGLVGCAATVDRGSGAGTSATTTTTQPVASAASSKNVVLQMTGTKEVLASKDYASLTEEIQRALSEKLQAAGAKIAVNPATVNKGVGTRVAVTLSDFRYVSTGARIAFGIMTGNAYINAKIEIFDLESDKKLTEQTFNTSSSAFQGIFSAMTPKQADAMADEIVALVGPR